MNFFIKFIYLMILISFFLFVGIGGIIKAHYEEDITRLKIEASQQEKNQPLFYKGIQFENYNELALNLMVKNIPRVYTWIIEEISPFLALIITSLSFGLLGGIIHLFRKNPSFLVCISWKDLLLFPVYGMLTGMVVLGISYLLPSVLVTNTGEVRPITLMFLSLFAGIFIDTFYIKLLKIFKNEI